MLTPPQRAVLLLRDVVGLSAEETAKSLECTVAAANSTLHRARVALEERVGPRAGWSPDARGPVDRALLERYMRAWESGDLDTVVSLLHEEVTLSMPPIPRWFSGLPAVERFFRAHVQEAAFTSVFRAALVEANGTLGLAFYRRREGVWRFFAVQLYEMRDGRIAVIDHFMSTSYKAAFFAAGLAETLPAS